MSSVCIIGAPTKPRDGRQTRIETTGKAVARQIEQATGEDCEAYSNVVGSAAITHDTMTARITPPSSVVDAAPTAGPFAGRITEIPPEARSANGLMKTAHATDEAAPHVPAATKH